METTEKKYVIRLDSKTLITVLEHQLYNKKWVAHFGSVAAVDKFIETYGQ